METWEVIAGILHFPIRKQKSPPAIPYFMKQTTWSLWPVFKIRVINAIWDGLNNLKETLGF